MSARAQSYFFELVYTPGGNEPPIRPPLGVFDLSAVAAPLGAEPVGLQFTIDQPERVESNPNSCTWVLWTPGMVNTPTAQAMLGSVSGIRGVPGPTAGCIIKVAGRV